MGFQVWMLAGSVPPLVGAVQVQGLCAPCGPRMPPLCEPLAGMLPLLPWQVPPRMGYCRQPAPGWVPVHSVCCFCCSSENGTWRECGPSSHNRSMFAWMRGIGPPRGLRLPICSCHKTVGPPSCLACPARALCLSLGVLLCPLPPCCLTQWCGTTRMWPSSSPRTCVPSV